MRKALGRGLSALIPTVAPSENENVGEEKRKTDVFIKVPIAKIIPNHLQPRKNFDSEKLSELAASIKEHGIAQPPVVSFNPTLNSYELISGERRWRAAQLAGFNEIEVIVRIPENDKERLSLALIENLQRQDLNAIEEAIGYLRLIKEFGISQTDLGRELGKSKSAISNTLRLLDLPEEIQKSIQFGQISEGHARALLMIQDAGNRHKAFRLILENKLSVRETEDLAHTLIDGNTHDEIRTVNNKKSVEKSSDIKELEVSLQHLLGTKIEIKTRKDPTKGTITIHFFSLSDFEKIVNNIKK